MVAGFWAEPPIGIEPMTYALREARYGALHPLPAPMPHASATTAPGTVGLRGRPFHDPFHALHPA
jgi:hypothetical protein